MELCMSRKERDRMKVIEQVERGLMSQVKAAEVLSLSVRQVRRIQGRYRRDGDRGLVHLTRGRPSPRRIDEAVRRRALEWIEGRYRDFGPTLASECLAEHQGIEVSRETVRGWMMEAGLWRGSRKKRPHRRRRARRPCRGELVQMDTSIHDWFEGRGEEAVLIAMIDDATNHAMERFFPADTTATNMAMIRDYVARQGRPMALYTDWASHFKHTSHRRERRMLGAKLTQIERALKELDIELIAARSPQAKGRVERRFGIDQDRLVKGLRLEGIATIEAANRYLEQRYLPRMNARFTSAPAHTADAHRSAQGLDLEAIFSVQQTRRVANDCTVQFKGQVFQIEAGQIAHGLAGTRLTVEQRLDGTVRMRWGDRYVGYRKLGPARSPNDGRAGDRSVGLRPPSRSPAKKYKPYVPPPDHPWRRGHF